MSKHPTRIVGGKNDTAVVATGVIMTGTVLIALMDGGITHMVFQFISGTSAYFIHNMTVNDLPPDLRKEARNVIFTEQNLMQGASMFAGIGVAADPIVGGILLVLSIIAHKKLDELREQDIKAELRAIVGEIGGICFA